VCNERQSEIPDGVFKIGAIICFPSVSKDAQRVENANCPIRGEAAGKSGQGVPGCGHNRGNEQGSAEMSYSGRAEGVDVARVTAGPDLREQRDDDEL
jgi:hypothetical protein